MPGPIQLLLIDPQNDFCDLPADWCPTDPATGQPLRPALPVAGAHADMLRVARLIREGAQAIDRITITLDSHHRLDIAHPGFWRSADGGPVQPFTQITAAQVRAGAFLPRDAQALPRTLAYLDRLEAQGRYTLMVWPVHCEIGSWGHNLHGAVRAACERWQDQRARNIAVVAKGSNPWTEHYSAIEAEVPDDADPATRANLALVRDLDEARLIVIAGEASSHCVRATTEHLAQYLPSRDLGKLVLVTDGMSPVGGFEAEHHTFLDGMAARGVRLCTAQEALARMIEAG